MVEKDEGVFPLREVVKSLLKAIATLLIIFSMLYISNNYRAEIPVFKEVPENLRFMDLFYPVMYFVLLMTISSISSKMEGIQWSFISVASLAGGWTLLLWGLLDFYSKLPVPGVEEHISLASLKLSLAFMIIGLYAFRFCSSMSVHHSIFKPAKGAGVMLVIYGIHTVVASSQLSQFSVIFIPIYILTALIYGLSALTLHRDERIKNLGEMFQKKTRSFIIAGLLVGVYVYLREFINFQYLHLLEYAVALFIMAKAASGIHTHLKGIDRIEETLSKHVQRIEYVKNPDFVRFESSINKFVREGDRVPIIVDITTLLHDLGVSNDRIQSIIKPIVEHRNRELPFFGFRWEIERTMRRNMEERREVLSEVLSNSVFEEFSNKEGMADESS